MGVCRRGACVEGEAEEGLGTCWRNRNVDGCEYMCDRDDCGGRGRVNRDVGRYAESAISVGYFAFGVRVGDGDGATKDDEPDAQKGKEKSPRRISARACHLADHTFDYSAGGVKLVVGAGRLGTALFLCD
jgi:hypothetical protein